MVDILIILLTAPLLAPPSADRKDLLRRNTPEMEQEDGGLLTRTMIDHLSAMGQGLEVGGIILLKEEVDIRTGAVIHVPVMHPAIRMATGGSSTK